MSARTKRKKWSTGKRTKIEIKLKICIAQWVCCRKLSGSAVCQAQAYQIIGQQKRGSLQLIECAHMTSRRPCWRSKQRNGGHLGGYLLGIKLYFYANLSFCFIVQIWLQVTWANTLCRGCWRANRTRLPTGLDRVYKRNNSFYLNSVSSTSCKYDSKSWNGLDSFLPRGCPLRSW